MTATSCGRIEGVPSIKESYAFLDTPLHYDDKAA